MALPIGSSEKAPKTGGGMALLRIVPLAALVLALAAFWWFGLNEYLTFSALRDNREMLRSWVEAEGIWAGLAFIAVYAFATALSVPGAALFTISSGFFFGPWWGPVLSIIGATLGATLSFLAARTAFAAPLRARLGGALHRMEQGFRKNAFSYLLFLRLVPVFPFWLVNLVSAFLDVPLTTFLLATFIGIIPAAIVYCGVGNGLGAVFDRGETPDLSVIFKPEILLPLLGLAALALVPVLYRRWYPKD